MLRLVTVKAAAQVVDRDPSRIYRWIDDGKLVKYLVNGLVCVNLDDLFEAESMTQRNTQARMAAARDSRHRRVVS